MFLYTISIQKEVSMTETKNNTKKPTYAVALCKGTFVAGSQWMCMKCNKVKNSPLNNPYLTCCGQPMVRVG